MRSTPNTRPYKAPYRYVCPKGHTVEHEEPLDVCPLAFCGLPLTRQGGQR